MASFETRALVLEIDDLVVEFSTEDGAARAVDGLSLSLHAGEVLGVVGESGSGKSVTFLSILGLVDCPPGRIVRGRALLKGQDLLAMSDGRRGRILGNDIAMVFQDPMASLNPVLSVGWQLREALKLHNRGESSRAAIRERAIELLELVGIPHARQRLNDYPHEFSGGMRQRVMIAMALANKPMVLIADEPTTALDVTIQAQVMTVLEEVRQKLGAATILITHDLGLIAQHAQRVLVMYGGRVVEEAPVAELFQAPAHPYTFGLLASRPRVDEDVETLATIEGSPPSLLSPPSGCAFHPRCTLPQRDERCRTEVPKLAPVSAGRFSACHFSEEALAAASGSSSGRSF